MRRGGGLDPLTTYLRSRPVRTPGLFRKLHKDYYARIEALEFTVQHDDGQRPAGRQLFRQGDFPVVDVTDKSLEETATEVVAVLQGPGDRRRARD
ncbi:MAG: kinase/pyrophosphorylase [Candidatus Methylomirabilales bacterium]